MLIKAFFGSCNSFSNSFNSINNFCFEKFNMEPTVSGDQEDKIKQGLALLEVIMIMMFSLMT